MSVFGVTAAKLGTNGYIEELTVRQIDLASNDWLGDPWVAAGHEVASMIVRGDRVLPIFIITGDIVPGPEFRHVLLPSGQASVELTQSSPGLTLQDLIHNVQDQS